MIGFFVKSVVCLDENIQISLNSMKQKLISDSKMYYMIIKMNMS